MVNKVILIGNLGQDPQVRSTQSGSTVTSFSMATNRRWKDRDGNRQEQTEWHQVVCFGRIAEVAGQFLAKGRQVYVEGRLQTSSWEDKNVGEMRYKTEVVCESLQLLGQRTGAEPAAEPAEQASEPEPAPKKKPRRTTAKKKS